MNYWGVRGNVIVNAYKFVVPINRQNGILML